MINQRNLPHGKTSRALLAGFLLLSITPSGPAGDAASSATGHSIPAIAEIAKIKVGFSTQQDLASQWGEGKPVTGGHPNSGRLWRVKGTPWVLRTDGFEYSKRGLVMDSLEISEDQKPGNGIPYARLNASDLAWLGEISLGTPQGKVMEVLKRKGLPFTQTASGCETAATGLHTLENKIQFRAWKVRFDFKRGLLSHLAIDAAARTNSIPTTSL